MNRTILILSQKDLVDAGCFDFASSIRVTEEVMRAYARGEILYPAKVSTIFDEETQNRINCLPAGLKKEKIYGMKWVSVFPVNPHLRGLPNLSATILLSETETGFPLALLEGTMCSNLRTAAVSTVAAKYLAVREPQTIGVIGAGEQAKSHFLAMHTQFPGISRCKVSSRTEDTEQTFIRQMRRFAPEVEFIGCRSDYKKAAEGSDIIVTAISGQEKLLQADWIKPGAFYCHVGGLEDDFAVAQKADKIVCDHWASVKHRTQTISQMYQQGLLTDADIYADLPEIVSGHFPGRESPEEFNYFNGVGLSYVDVALSYWMYRRAAEKGVGTTIVMQDKSIFEL